MSYSINPSIVTSGLVLHHDAANLRCYDGRENLMTYSNYNVATWSVNAAGTLTTGIDAPDGTNTAVRVTCNNVSPTLFRIYHPSHTPNGTDTYTVSFWARLISGSSGNALAADWTDGSPSGNYTPSLVAGQWVRIQYTAVPTATAKTFFDILSDATNNYVVDFWGVQIERGATASTLTPTSGSTVTRGTSIISLSGTNTGTMNGNVAFTSTNGGAFRLSGNATAQGWIQVPAGHADYTQGITIQIAASMDTTLSSYQRFIDFGNGAGSNNIVFYRLSSTSQVGFDLYSSSTRQTLVTSSGLLNNNENAVWCATADGTYMRIYKNGVQVASATSSLIPTNVTRNNCYIGRSNWAWPSDPDTTGNFYDLKIYNRALTATEVAKNAAALRGRFNV